MAESGIAPGTPIWTDLSSPDVEASARFYGAVFGWTSHPGGPESGGYTLFHTADGRQVAGVAPLASPGQPPAWNTYVSVEDADAAAARAAEAGGKVLMAADVLDQGRVAIVEDPTGAVISLWQPRAHRGAEVFNVPGAMSWTELATRDVPAATAFYAAVFGWGARTSGEGSESYTEWVLGDRSVGGMLPMPEQVPAGVPAHWLVYFAVDDTEATARRASELGAQVMVPPVTIPQGTFAVLADPHGAEFAVIALSRPS
jgi:uncharacterized protein